MVKVMYVLILYLNGGIIELMGHHEKDGEWVEMGVPGCLAMKRTLSRNGWKDSDSGETRYSCEKKKVEVGDNWEGREVVKKLLD